MSGHIPIYCPNVADFHTYIREILKPIANDVSKNSPHAYMRYETKPAEQMQYDWSPYTVAFGVCATI